ncbi:hypothetical protein KIN20_025531 [Parelaphostrongylus tenuis]|uniref:Uncharacterized protein n=1 Tax=Parelaphostrongylus tenuis TaxID=148309 RepID=A0AAD5QXA0_PARTN|nr:hypothetical protein KIN20_025531 [Parelaphostrongylus tenuis]
MLLQRAVACEWIMTRPDEIHRDQYIKIHYENIFQVCNIYGCGVCNSGVRGTDDEDGDDHIQPTPDPEPPTDKIEKWNLYENLICVMLKTTGWNRANMARGCLKLCLRLKASTVMRLSEPSSTMASEKCQCPVSITKK